MPIPKLIRSARTSGRTIANSSIAAGRPEPKAVQTPRTVAQASSPFTTEVASEESA